MPDDFSERRPDFQKAGFFLPEAARQGHERVEVQLEDLGQGPDKILVCRGSWAGLDADYGGSGQPKSVRQLLRADVFSDSSFADGVAKCARGHTLILSDVL